MKIANFILDFSVIVFIMLQNRVNPQGNIIKTSARGVWLGNRGQLHGTGKTILRPFKHKAWIICQLQFKERHRQAMAPNLWTELFFLDEATAFAAGHRPCFECRRDAAVLFKTAWLKGNAQYGFDNKISINKIDEVVHQERIDSKHNKITFKAMVKDLPDGTFILLNDLPCLVAKNQIFKWSPFGYESVQPTSPLTIVTVLTPASIVNTFRAGYAPQMGI